MLLTPRSDSLKSALQAVFLASMFCLCDPTSVNAQILPESSDGIAPPIIDVHVHGDNPPPGMRPLCPNTPQWLASDPAGKEATFGGVSTGCSNFFLPASPSNYVAKVAEHMRRLNVTAVVISDPSAIAEWQRSSPGRVIPAIGLGSASGRRTVEELRTAFQQKGFKVLGEIGFQYDGIDPSDDAVDSYFALAEELDVPVAIHMGTGGAGRANINSPNFRASLGDPLLLEQVLARHPKLRIYIMHAGYPLIDNLLALLAANSHVYVDTAGLIWSYPLSEVNAYLKRIVSAGFADRVMFGSDELIWPDILPYSISVIEQADYLSPQQKRDILYNNAARFFRLQATSEAHDQKGR